MRVHKHNHATRVGESRPTRSSCVRAFAFKADGGTATFPVTHYDVLRVQQAASREAVLRSYRGLLEHQPSSLGDDTLHTRTCILDMACSSLLDLELRR